MIVYRVEHRETREGPYWAPSATGAHRDYCHHLSRVHSDDPAHPSPFQELLPTPREGDFCGFASVDALFAWFNESERSTLRDFGYCIALYEAHETYHGRRQLFFRRDESALKGRADILTLEPLAK